MGGQNFLSMKNGIKLKSKTEGRTTTKTRVNKISNNIRKSTLKDHLLELTAVSTITIYLA
jgi:hypothetical protein